MKSPCASLLPPPISPSLPRCIRYLRHIYRVFGVAYMKMLCIQDVLVLEDTYNNIPVEVLLARHFLMDR